MPDFHKFGSTIGTPTLLEEETIKLIALTKGVTPAQVVLNWEWMQVNMAISCMSLQST